MYIDIKVNVYILYAHYIHELCLVAKISWTQAKKNKKEDKIPD